MLYTSSIEVRDDLWDSAWDIIDSKIKMSLIRTIVDDTYHTITFINHGIKTPIIWELKDAVA
jgi:hypothetical protein